MSATHKDTETKGSLENAGEPDPNKGNEKYHFGKRFKQWRQDNGISAYRIAKMTGVHPSFISNIEASRRPMSDSFMRKLATIKEFSINYETLRAWKIQSEYDVDEMKEALSNALHEGSNKGVDTLLTDPLRTSAYFHVPLQLVGTADGIQQLPAGEELKLINWIGVRRDNQDICCIQIRDASLWPPLPKNAVLLVQKTSQPQSGKRYLAVTSQGMSLYEADGNNLISLVPNTPSASLTELDSANLYQVLAFKVDWS